MEMKHGCKKWMNPYKRGTHRLNSIRLLNTTKARSHPTKSHAPSTSTTPTKCTALTNLRIYACHSINWETRRLMLQPSMSSNLSNLLCTSPSRDHRLKIKSVAVTSPFSTKKWWIQRPMSTMKSSKRSKLEHRSGVSRKVYARLKNSCMSPVCYRETAHSLIKLIREKQPIRSKLSALLSSKSM